MKLDASMAILWGAVAILMLVAWRKKGWAGVREGFSGAWELAKTVIQIVPLALLAATFFAQLVPSEFVAGLIGRDTGLTGIAIASVAGGLVPSGPFLSFPLALSLFHTGAGSAQVVAFITGWSVYAFYRVMVWEVPTMGVQFTMLRVGVSLFLPFISGLLAAVMFQSSW
jgi:uncharacterized membrane protein YraQ (UPF0718 family)